MKKCIFAVITIISAIMLSACSGGNSGSSTVKAPEAPSAVTAEEKPNGREKHTTEAAPQTAEAPAADLQAIYDKIIAAQSDDELIMLPESSPEIIDSYYAGLSDVKLRQQMLYMAPVTGFACEVMLVEAENSANADKAEEVFRARIELGASEDFYPETAAAWKQNSQVQRSGNLVCMIALPEGHEIPDDVFAL